VPVHRHINNFFGDIFMWYGTIGCWQLRASVGYISFITGFARPMVASSPMFVTHCLAFGPMRKSYYSAARVCGSVHAPTIGIECNCFLWHLATRPPPVGIIKWLGTDNFHCCCADSGSGVSIGLDYDYDYD
jgi:hypothetical protein